MIAWLKALMYGRRATAAFYLRLAARLLQIHIDDLTDESLLSRFSVVTGPDVAVRSMADDLVICGSACYLPARKPEAAIDVLSKIHARASHPVRH